MSESRQSEFDPLESIPELTVRCGEHPSLDRLLAVGQGVLPPEAEAAVEQHLQLCPLCTGLLADMATLPEQPFTPAQQQRIATTLPRPARSRVWIYVTAAGAIAAALLLATNLTSTKLPLQTPPSPIIARVEQPPIAPGRPDLPLTALPAPPEEAPRLLTRGARIDRNPSAEELRPALEAYTAADYRTAAEGFTALTFKYPGSDVLFLYLGISQLFLDQNRQAEQSLTKAHRNARPAQADAIAWYTTIVTQRLHPGEERGLLEGLCQNKRSPYALQSCQAMPSHP